MIVGVLRTPSLSGVLPSATAGTGEPLLPWKACFGWWQETHASPRGSERFLSSNRRLPRSCKSFSDASSAEWANRDGVCAELGRLRDASKTDKRRARTRAVGIGDVSSDRRSRRRQPAPLVSELTPSNECDAIWNRSNLKSSVPAYGFRCSFCSTSRFRRTPVLGRPANCQFVAWAKTLGARLELIEWPISFRKSTTRFGATRPPNSGGNTRTSSSPP